VFSPLVRIEERPLEPRGMASGAFDEEGVATRRRAIVRDGVVEGYFLGSYSARKLGMKSTGSAGGHHNLLVRPGDLDFRGMLREMGQGLLVTELLGALRKERGLTQQALAEMVEMHISQIRRYEGGQSQPTLDVIRKLAMALSVSADMLLFEKDERGPDEELRFQFEAVSRLDPEEKKVIRSVIESIILRHEARRWSSPGSEAK
jgi:transcriptional regulator with XRE-family HTH domain